MRPELETPELSTFGLREHRADRAIHVALWAGQIVLALVFFATGGAKLALTLAELQDLVPWAATTPEPVIRLMGAAELAGSLGLVLPALTGIRPGLTPLAAAGLAVVMTLAAAFHLHRGQPVQAVLPAVLGLVAIVVGWGRARVSRIAARPVPPLEP